MRKGEQKRPEYKAMRRLITLKAAGVYEVLFIRLPDGSCKMVVKNFGQPHKLEMLGGGE